MCTAVPVYVGEIAQPSVRGSSSAMNQGMLYAGIVYTYCLGGWAQPLHHVVSVRGLKPTVRHMTRVIRHWYFTIYGHAISKFTITHSSLCRCLQTKLSFTYIYWHQEYHICKSPDRKYKTVFAKDVFFSCHKSKLKMSFLRYNFIQKSLIHFLFLYGLISMTIVFRALLQNIIIIVS